MQLLNVCFGAKQTIVAGAEDDRFAPHICRRFQI